jgi:predicted helicase
MDLHINYETVKPFKLKIVGAGLVPARRNAAKQTTGEDKPRPYNDSSRPKLKADKISGTIELDSETILQGVPSSAWEYKLGNRSALEWILDQYKEKKPSDATIREKFNSYRFADYKETVIDLLRRVCTVSVRTMKIIDQMPEEV